MRQYNYGGGYYRRPGLFGGGFSLFPSVIKTLLIANAGIFLFMFFFGNFRLGNVSLNDYILYYFALRPLGAGFAPWQLLSYMFLHGSFFHIFFNMFILWMFGMELENMWGSRKFLTFYLLCGIGAGIIHMFVSPFFAGAAPTIGASGAVYGVLLAFAMMFPDRMIFIYFLFPVRAKYFVGFLIVIGLFMGISGTRDGIAHFAHLGGVLIAYIYLLVDSGRIPLKRWFSGYKRSGLNYYGGSGGIKDAKYTEVKEEEKKDESLKVEQEKIDKILEKISKSGYQNLTEEEKKILFEASKKLK